MKITIKTIIFTLAISSALTGISDAKRFNSNNTYKRAKDAVADTVFTTIRRCAGDVFKDGKRRSLNDNDELFPLTQMPEGFDLWGRSNFGDEVLPNGSPPNR